MSKNRLRNSTESNRVENRPSAPSAQPIASPHAQPARPSPRPRAYRLASPATRAPRAPAPAAAQLLRACLPASPLPAARLCRPPIALSCRAPRLRTQAPRARSPSAQPSAKPRAHAPYAPSLRFLPSQCSNGQYPISGSAYFFFFLSFSHWKIPKKYIYLFSFIFQYTNNLLKFISSLLYIFFHFPTNQINCLNLFYLFSCSSFPTCLCAIYLSTQTFTSHIQHVIHTKHIHTTIHQST